MGTYNYNDTTLYNLRMLYEQMGYKRFKMSKFEEYDLYVKNKDFLISDSIITFTDRSGKLVKHSMLTEKKYSQQKISLLSPTFTVSSLLSSPISLFLLQRMQSRVKHRSSITKRMSTALQEKQRSIKKSHSSVLSISVI